MKNKSPRIFCGAFATVLLAGSMMAGSVSCAPIQAKEWKAMMIPASLNENNTIQLASGEIQPLNIALQTDDSVTAKAQNHALEMEWDLPAGMEIVSNGGLFKFSNPTTKTENGRSLTRFDVQVTNSAISGKPDSRLASEGKNHSVFVSAPMSVAAGQNYIRLHLKSGENVQTFEWPLKLVTLTPPAAHPKLTAIGLWDYNYSRATDQTAATGIARLFKDSGVNFTHSANDATYRGALQKQGIVTGGSVHHSAFRDSKYPDYDAAGKVLSSSLAYANPQAILNLPQDANIPGVKQLIEAAKAGDGIANFDYEPNGLAGFSPLATQAFLAQNQVSAEDFEKFRAEVAKRGFKTRLSQDKMIAEIWRKWVAFRSEQTSNYVRRISEAVKAQAPDVRLAVTSSRTAGKDSLGTLSLGTDNAAMAQFADVIMPQLYSGYSGANAKLVMQMTENWRRELQQQNAKTQLWPLLLVRYSGATVYNSPERLHQQIIGTLAHGANGIGLYYPGNMDGSYWEMLARTTEEIAKTEDFYQKGSRAEAEFPLSALPVAAVKIAMFPDYEETVKNPDWSFTAHRLENRVLLTLMNLGDAKDLTFGVDIGKSKVVETKDAKKSGDDQWTVAPGQIGFVTLERE